MKFAPIARQIFNPIHYSMIVFYLTAEMNMPAVMFEFLGRCPRQDLKVWKIELDKPTIERGFG